MARFDRFVMFAEMRTGSNLLEAMLNGLPGVVCHGELFNPHFIGKKDQTEFLGLTMAERNSDPARLMERLAAASGGMTGFRYFHDHDPRVFDLLLADPRCAKIVLSRNPLDSYVSWKIAQATGQWKLTNAKSLKTATALFDEAEFEERLADQQACRLRLLRGLQVTGQTAFYLDYDDLGDLDVLNGIAAFLGVPALAEMPQVKLKKQNPDEVADKVQNPAEMAAAMARVDWAGLGRTPHFEPRRGPALPAMRASVAAPLLFLPVRGGPDVAVTTWLGKFGDAGVRGAFTQKDLRQWKRANPGHRSFTVLRHPAARAHAVFCSQIVSGRLADVRSTLMRQQQINLPAPGKAQPLADHRAAFLGFLRFVKMNLCGQTNLRVDPHWASQVAVLQGFAQMQTPDLILREDAIERGLGWLADMVGLTPPVFTAEPVSAPYTLSDIYDAEVEAAVRDAYQRDYVAFGFGPWGHAA